jgi:hypothetical protein
MVQRLSSLHLHLSLRHPLQSIVIPARHSRLSSSRSSRKALRRKDIHFETCSLSLFDEGIPGGLS